MTICIVDTSVLVELLPVPGRDARHAELLAEFENRQAAREEFLLSISVMIETGNFVAQVQDGIKRRTTAAKFVSFARAALDRQSPFVPAHVPSASDVRRWLTDFTESAARGLGLTDHGLIGLWEEQCETHPSRRVYVWSLDRHLSARDRRP